MVHIAITNSTGFTNKGVESFVKTIIYHSLRSYDNPSITIYSDRPEYDKYRFSTISTREKDFRVNFVRTPYHKSYFKMVGLFKKRISSADIVVSVGGDVFSSYYGDLDRHLAPLQAAIELNKKLFLMGHTVGPFRDRVEYRKFMNLASRADAITLRDESSYALMYNHKLKKARVYKAADPAFLLDKKSFRTNSRAFHSKYDFDSEKKDIACLSPMGNIQNFIQVPEEVHLGIMRDIVEYLVKRKGYSVVLAPNSLHDVETNDDLLVCQNIYDDLSEEAKIKTHIISPYLSAEEYKEIISEASLMISERMHAGISALSEGVPTILIPYSQKHYGLLKEIFGERYPDYSYPLSTPGEDNTKDFVNDFLDNLQWTREFLKKRIPEIKESAELNLKILDKLVGKVLMSELK